MTQTENSGHVGRPLVACLGAGRMGRGIAVAFAYAGHEVVLVDVKVREPNAFAALAGEARDEVAGTLAMLAGFGLFEAERVDALARRVTVVDRAAAGGALAGAGIVFEGVPEILAVKHEALRWASGLVRDDAIVASTTSTIMVDDMAEAVGRPERFLNAHWLNPAYLVPLVELSPGARTAPETLARMEALLDRIGKKPVVCRSSPGFIVPRIQALAMNEAARMVEEGVASADAIDAAVRYGFGFRFAVLGLLEFIDWGGGDILFHASRYLEDRLGDPRYRAPDIVSRNMETGRRGFRDGHGFLDYSGIDVDRRRRERLRDFVDLLRHMGLDRPPVLPDDSSR